MLSGKSGLPQQPHNRLSKPHIMTHATIITRAMIKGATTCAFVSVLSTMNHWDEKKVIVKISAPRQ